MPHLPHQRFSHLAIWLAVGVMATGTLARSQDDQGAPPQQSPTDQGPPPPSYSSDQAAPQGDPNAPAPDASAGQDAGASFQTFYDSLASQGTWVQSSDYGYVWQPTINDPNWAPYTDGNWVYSDEGWTWNSDESFGWATYHYGRWANIDGTGWCWVPGYTWAPAWVSWRYGDGDVGWAPLPPDSFVGIDYGDSGFDGGYGYHIGGDCDNFYGIGAGCYIFLPIDFLGHKHYGGHYRNRDENFERINHTTNVTNINVNRGNGRGNFHQVSAGGPTFSQVNAMSSIPVQRVGLVHSHDPGVGTISNNSLSLYAPRVRPVSTAEPSHVSGQIMQARINHGTDIGRPLAVNSRLTPVVASDAQVQAARQAQEHAPPNAKVLTGADSGSFHPLIHAPLSTMSPVRSESSVPRGTGMPGAVESFAPRGPAGGQPYNNVQRVSPGPAASTERNGPVTMPGQPYQDRSFAPNTPPIRNVPGESGGERNYIPPGAIQTPAPDSGGPPSSRSEGPVTTAPRSSSGGYRTFNGGGSAAGTSEGGESSGRPSPSSGGSTPRSSGGATSSSGGHTSSGGTSSSATSSGGSSPGGASSGGASSGAGVGGGGGRH